MRSSSSSLHSSNAGPAGSSASGNRDPSVAASAAAPSRPSSQSALLPSSGHPLPSARQSHASSGSASRAAAPSVPGSSRPGALSSSGAWRIGMGSAGGGSASAGAAPSASRAEPSQASTGQWRRSFLGGSSRSGASSAAQGAGPTRSAPASQGSVLTQIYAGLTNQASEVQSRISQLEAAGDLTPETAATLWSQYNVLAEENAAFGEDVARSGISRVVLSRRGSTSSGDPSLSAAERWLGRAEAESAIRSNAISNRWTTLDEAISQRDAISAIHEDLSRRAADVIASINSIESSGVFTDQFASNLRSTYSQLNQANSIARSIIGDADQVSRQSEILREAWSTLGDFVSDKEVLTMFPRGGGETSDHQESQASQVSQGSRPTAPPPSEMLLQARDAISGWSRDNEAQAVAGAYDEITKGPDESFAR